MKKIHLLTTILLLGGVQVMASGLPKPTLQAIIKALQDSNAEVRIAAAQVLSQVPDDSAARPLETALIASSDAAEQEALVKALAVVDDKGTAKRLSDALVNPQFTWGNGAKARAVQAIAKSGDKKIIKWLTDQVTS